MGRFDVAEADGASCAEPAEDVAEACEEVWLGSGSGEMVYLVCRTRPRNGDQRGPSVLTLGLARLLVRL